MRICIPTTDEAGEGGWLSPHFGRAPYFTYVDAGDGTADVVTNAHARHDHGRCLSPATMGERGVEAVICLGIGRNAMRALGAQGIVVYLTQEQRVSDALAEFRAGRLVRMTEEDACHGGAHAGH